jgi:spore coat protein CotF
MEQRGMERSGTEQKGTEQRGTNLSERSVVHDCLASQKMINATYNSFIEESATADLRRDLQVIQKQEQDSLYRVFQAMNQRGWYKTQPADQQQVSQARDELKPMPPS